MNIFSIIFTADDKQRIKDFLSLPKHLYHKNERMQNESEELAVLTGTHTLSRSFSVIPFLIYKDKKAAARAVVTIYPGDDTAYLGFFESENDPAVAGLLFETAFQIAKEKNKTRIVGPVDASFWIKYRLKTNYFGSPYTGEPYNKDYYEKLWRENGFHVWEHYSSNHYTIVESDEDCEIYTERLARKLKDGYEIVSPSDETFDAALKEVYSLLIEGYRHFPAYKKISEEEFCSLYAYLKSILNYPMVKMAYYEGKAVGFFISLPNYGNAIYGKLHLWNLPKILAIKKHPKSYVMLCMGVDSQHRGLGKALAESIRNELKTLHIPSIGALIRDGNCNKNYVGQLIDFEYEYVLFEKELSN